MGAVSRCAHRVLSAIEALDASRADREDRRTNDLPRLTIDLVPNALTTNDTRLLFNRPTEDEVFQVGFANYTVQALFAEGYYLSRTSREQRAIRAALDELERASEFERVSILLDKGVIPPGYSAESSSSYEQSTNIYGSREAHEHALLKELRNQQQANEGFAVFENHIRRAFDYWCRRRTIQEPEFFQKKLKETPATLAP